MIFDLLIFYPLTQESKVLCASSIIITLFEKTSRIIKILGSSSPGKKILF